MKKGYIADIAYAARENTNFREVIYTSLHSQLVLMSLLSEENIGEEVHDVDQFIRVETGSGKAWLNGTAFDIEEGYAIIVPAGIRHDIQNTSDGTMKLYTLYSPPSHRDRTIHKTRAHAEADLERFDGITTE